MGKCVCPLILFLCLCFQEIVGGLTCSLAFFFLSIGWVCSIITILIQFPNDGENQLKAALSAVSALKKPYKTMFNVHSFNSLSPAPPIHSDLMSNVLFLIFEQTRSLCLMFYW
jgi:hypothetical protein